MQIGPVRFTVDTKSHAAQRPFTHKLVVRDTGFKTSSEGASAIEGLGPGGIGSRKISSVTGIEEVEAVSELHDASGLTLPGGASLGPAARAIGTELPEVDASAEPVVVILTDREGLAGE